MKAAALIPALAVLAVRATGGGGQWLEDPHDAVQYLIGCLVADGAWDEAFPDSCTFHIENSESETADTPRSHHDVLVRERLPVGSEDDPAGGPLLYRFRVYFDGTVRYYSTIPGFFIPYEDFLEGRTDL